MAIEDYLGAGAILSELSYPKSPEARVCEGSFRQSRRNLDEIIWDCGSGRELREAGFGDDVRHAARLDLYDVAPLMQDGALI